jgi:quercetin dioxygenase-like cupin family protein
MKMMRVYAGDDEQSHFEDIEVPFDGAEGRRTTEAFSSDSVRFATLPAGVQMDYHHAPARQFVIVLDGSLEMGCGDGSTVQCSPGDVFLADDHTGQGHTFRELSGPISLLFVPFSLDVDVEPWRHAR